MEITVGLSLAGAIVSVTSAIVGNRYRIASLKAIMEQKVKTLKEENDSLHRTLKEKNGELRKEVAELRAEMKQQMGEIKADLKAAVTELATAATTVKVFGAETAIINKMTSDTLAALTRKTEQHDKEINEVSGTVSLFSEILTQKGILG